MNTVTALAAARRMAAALPPASPLTRELARIDGTAKRNAAKRGA